MKPLSVAGLSWIDRAARRDADALDDTGTEGKEEAVGVAAINAIDDEVAEAEVGAGTEDGIGTETGVGTGAVSTTATLFSFLAMLFSRIIPGTNPPPSPPLLPLPSGDSAKDTVVLWVSDSEIP